MSWLTTMLVVDSNHIPSDHIGVFRQSYKPKTSMIHCCYATDKGLAPTKTRTKWCLELDYGNDLINGVVTRCSLLSFSNVTNEIDSTAHNNTNERATKITKTEQSPTSDAGKLSRG